MRKILTCIIVLSILLMNVKAYASSLPSAAADGVLLLDTNSGKVLYEKNIHTTFYPASTTKIMTALLVLEHCKLDDKVVIGKNPSSFVDGNKIYLHEGEEFTVDELLHALLIESANDVAIAFAEHISGTVEEFSKLMNERARQLGCLNTNFVTPNGLHDKNHYTTAYDLSLIAREAMKNPLFRELVSTKTYTMQPTNKQPKQRELYSNNQIILNTKYRVEGANGVKVGFTDEALHTFVGSAVRGDTNLMVVLLNDPTKQDMYKDASSLLNYGFDTHKTVRQVSEGDIITYYNVPGTDAQIPLTAQRSWYYTYQIDKVPDIKSDVMLSNDINYSSINKGQVMGYVEYSDAGEIVGTVELLSDSSFTLPKMVKAENTFKYIANKYHIQWIFMSFLGLVLAGGTLWLLKRNETLNL